MGQPRSPDRPTEAVRPPTERPTNSIQPQESRAMMFALLPPEMQREPTLLLFALLVVAFVCFSLALVQKNFPRFIRVCFVSIGCISSVILMVFCLFPSVARVERLYHQGHDQFYWGGRSHSPVPKERR